MRSDALLFNRAAVFVGPHVCNFFAIVSIRQWHRHTHQRDFENFVYPAYRTYVQAALDVVRNLGEILAVLFRNQYGLNAAAVRSKQFLLQAPDR